MPRRPKFNCKTGQTCKLCPLIHTKQGKHLVHDPVHVRTSFKTSKDQISLFMAAYSVINDDVIMQQFFSPTFPPVILAVCL